jgi:2-polyprenyl-3-methyl-5-hydroxy-6-metoxy-1,4-benzoquinol methylase
MRTFDRTEDVPKLVGCNTRNVKYRWSIFERAVSTIRPASDVLDFGAGSLRETYELALRGFHVTAVDLDLELLRTYEAHYDWTVAAHLPAIVAAPNLSDGLNRLGSKKFSFIICFDVFEHLDDPIAIMRQMRDVLEPGGLLLCSVPNGRTLYELSFWLDMNIARATGRPLVPGEAHLQRNSPAKWRGLLQDAGFEIVEHDMAIGFFVNTVSALVQIPMLLAGRAVRVAGYEFSGAKVHDQICRPTLMTALDKADQATKSAFRSLYGWNLFVVRKPA